MTDLRHTTAILRQASVALRFKQFVNADFLRHSLTKWEKIRVAQPEAGSFPV